MVFLVLTDPSDKNALIWFWSSAILYGMSWGMNSPTVQAWTADLSDERTRGRAMATMYIALEAGIGLGAIASGWLLNHWIGEIGVDASFAVSGALAVVAVFYLAWYWQQGIKAKRQRMNDADEMALLDEEP
jgi:MFS family permease